MALPHRSSCTTAWLATVSRAPRIVAVVATGGRDAALRELRRRRERSARRPSSSRSRRHRRRGSGCRARARRCAHAPSSRGAASAQYAWSSAPTTQRRHRASTTLRVPKAARVEVHRGTPSQGADVAVIAAPSRWPSRCRDTDRDAASWHAPASSTIPGPLKVQQRARAVSRRARGARRLGGGRRRARTRCCWCPLALAAVARHRRRRPRAAAPARLAGEVGIGAAAGALASPPGAGPFGPRRGRDRRRRAHQRDEHARRARRARCRGRVDRRRAASPSCSAATAAPSRSPRRARSPASSVQPPSGAHLPRRRGLVPARHRARAPPRMRPGARTGPRASGNRGVIVLVALPVMEDRESPSSAAFAPTIRCSTVTAGMHQNLSFGFSSSRFSSRQRN